MDAIQWIDYLGVFAFSMSGLLAASEKKMDMLGGFIMAFVTALGGGTIRDLLLDVEISWFFNVHYVYVVIVGATFTLLFKKATKRIRTTLFLFDSIGIGLFTILGVQKALSMELPIVVVLITGVIAATFGGVLRDILCNEIPLLFRKEIYATACFAGAACYVALNHFGLTDVINLAISGSVIVAIRTVSVLCKLSLPVINSRL